MNSKFYGSENLNNWGIFTADFNLPVGKKASDYFTGTNTKLWRASELLAFINDQTSNPLFLKGYDYNGDDMLTGVKNDNQINRSSVLAYQSILRLYDIKTGNITSEYDVDMLYEKNAKVIYNNTVYISLQDNNLNNIADNLFWMKEGALQATIYSVNSAKTDSNGRANFITKVSNTEISFDTNSGSISINITYPDGSFEINNTLPNITGISTDGTYYVIKEKTGSPYLTTLQPVEGYVVPSSPSNGQLWLDISVMPYAPKKWNGSSWVVAQFVKLGEFTRTSSIIGTPISYALNRMYVSSNTSFTYGSAVNISHNLGVNPIFIKETIHVVNISTEYGYLPGETLMGAINYNASSDSGQVSIYTLKSALLGINNSRFIPTNTTGFGGIRGVAASTGAYTGAITPANWRLVFVYDRNF